LEESACASRRNFRFEFSCRKQEDGMGNLVEISKEKKLKYSMDFS